VARRNNCKNPEKPIIVVFGLDKTDKPHAARLNGDQAEAAISAGTLLGFSVARAETDLAKFLTKELKEARVSKSGKARVPPIKWALYDQLSMVLSPYKVQAGHALPPPGESGSQAPSPFDPWSTIELNRVVLWRETPGDGWYEAVVVGIAKDRKTLRLRWRDHEGLPTFKVKRHAVGLICIIR
jgi:hypothetical protein